MRLFDEGSGLYYEIKDDKAVIVEASSHLYECVIPDKLGGYKVTAIRKKAFLGCKQIKKIYVSEEIDEIGDFAFALCNHLSVVSFPYRNIKVGQSIFKNDNLLNMIEIRNDRLSDDAFYLSAASYIKMEAEYLLDIGQIGTKDWYAMFDRKLIDMLNRNDDEGYHLYVLCGEEDLHFDYDQYVEYIRERKCGLCMIRLLKDSELLIDNKDRFKNYIKLHIPCDTGEDNISTAAFEYLYKEHGDDKEYYEMLIREGLITKDNREAMLLLLKDRHPETKAYLINAFSDETSENFFDDLLL